MYRKIFDKPLDTLTEADLLALVERGVTEGPHLDYKRGLGTKGENKELAKDVVAFANAYGGYLVFGVEETKGGEEGEAEIEIVGLPIEDRDRLLTAIEHAVRDLTTPSVEVRTKAIELSTRDEQGRPLYVVVVEVPPSLNAPHMASHVFYRRGDRTSSKMDYMEIRRAFSQRGDLVRGMRERLQRRIEDL
ncbi:MAG TPA: ATP-binding protein, partial [Oceanithermus sp.]|nr:ATP-binding protein [Oceanithermus sp.]